MSNETDFFSHESTEKKRKEVVLLNRRYIKKREGKKVTQSQTEQRSETSAPQWCPSIHPRLGVIEAVAQEKVADLLPRIVQSCSMIWSDL